MAYIDTQSIQELEYSKGITKTFVYILYRLNSISFGAKKTA